MNIWKTEIPKTHIVALCSGEAYDGCSFNDEEYFVAEYMAHWDEPKWVYGKQQNECTVKRYITITDL